MKNLTKYEKLKRFQDYRFNRNERHLAAVYLNAIRKDDKTIMESFERFGNDLYHIFENYKTNERNIELGFGELGLKDYGWIEMGKMREVSVIVFDDNNNIRSGVSPNQKWDYGINMELPSMSGRYSGCSIWGAKYSTEQDALLAGLNELQKWYERELNSLTNAPDSNEDDEEYKAPKVSSQQAFCKRMIKLANQKIFEVKYPQLELF